MSKPGQRKKQKVDPLVDGRLFLYNQHGAPYEVFNLAAFCREHGLSEQAIRDVVRGQNKQHQGWHLDRKRTTERVEGGKRIKAMMDESQAKYGVPFEFVW